MRKSLLFVIVIYFSLPKFGKDNVCKNFGSYWTIDINSNCWYNPDLYATQEKIASNHGFPFEKHELTTEDGFTIALFRIPHNGTDSLEVRPLVLLHPGIGLDSSGFFALGNRSIGFIFSNEGYDVWFINPRGTVHSQKHTNYTVEDKDFWKFSFHEMGVYDLPIIIDFIKQKSGNPGPVKLIGQSMGSTASFVYASVKSKHAQENLQSIIALGPAVFWNETLFTLIKIGGFIQKIVAEPNHLFQNFGSDFNIQSNILKKFCPNYPWLHICMHLVNIATGFEDTTSFPEFLPVFFSNLNNTQSMKTLVHYMQNYNAKSFSYFDYGTEENLHIYNKSQPPNYPLEDIKVPVHLFYGTNDYVSTEQSADELYQVLKTNKTLNKMENYGHLNFLLCHSAPDLYYNLTKL